MRVDWQQELEGYTLLQIRDALRGPRYSDCSFGPSLFSERLPGATKKKAQQVLDGLLASGLIRPTDEDASRFQLTDTGISLRAAHKSKRFPRARADKAMATLLERAAEVNADPIFMHDVTAVAVYGSYITDAPDLGDIDIAIGLRGRWLDEPGEMGKRGNDRDRRKAEFDARYPPPKSFYDKWWWATWAETYTTRLLRTDRAIKTIEMGELEMIGCPYRIIFPQERDVPAKPDWSLNRQPVVLKTAALTEN